ncbi:hypothetical protein [Okeania sp. KiyG1]|uniref:hypothetical protein n=1 Tax=Okeania sp. KiyG1 TaxID=2720165 RepID=UPI00192229A3|nr:hypothetical protein [Okeania sp. KiyG1]
MSLFKGRRSRGEWHSPLQEWGSGGVGEWGSGEWGVGSRGVNFNLFTLLSN